MTAYPAGKYRNMAGSGREGGGGPRHEQANPRISGEIYTPSQSHPRRSRAGSWGGRTVRVKKIAGHFPEEQMHTFAGLDAKLTPETGDGCDKFVEFNQYGTNVDRRLDPMDAAEWRKTVKELVSSMCEKFTAVLCSFENDYPKWRVRPSVHKGRAMPELERGRKLGNLPNRHSKVANRITNAIKFLLNDKTFILSGIRIRFRRANDKAPCNVQALPFSRSLCPHASQRQPLYVRGPSPWATKLNVQEQSMDNKSKPPNCG